MMKMLNKIVLKYLLKFIDHSPKIVAVVYIFLEALMICRGKKLLDVGVWHDYFSESRVSLLINFYSIVIGMYIAVITILATSRLSISEDILKERLDSKLIRVMLAGIIENLAVVVMLIAVPSSIRWYYDIVLVTIIVALLSLIKFICFLAIFFQLNMEAMAKEIDEENQRKGKDRGFQNSLMNALKEISENIRQDNC